MNLRAGIKEAGKDATDIVDIAAAAMTGLMIIGQILAQIVRGDMRNALINDLQQFCDGGLVIMQRLFAAAFHTLGGKKHFQKLLIALRLGHGLGTVDGHHVLAPKRRGSGLRAGPSSGHCPGWTKETVRLP